MNLNLIVKLVIEDDELANYAISVISSTILKRGI